MIIQTQTIINMLKELAEATNLNIDKELDEIYNFFLKKLKMKPDVAKLITDFTTVNFKDSFNVIETGVNDFVKNKKIRNVNHLPSGTPTSQILAYLANVDMYDEIIKLLNK